ncbi:RNA polymerase sigma factor RpoH [Zwartia vadi]|uniref:RNA polymerase sigma factor RpoH n=1 Tax=Zwartia vadi TaxID=3058168 RepID=UPI0025B4B6A7|nr:RNA polymerase sigma factor RpoH [Zwartia vadi]MDN3987768.1 RNA polymerase sigma factor RpoH [Zwartia vadi]
MTNTAALTLQPSQLAMAISNPGSLGTIEAYISTVNRLPVLTPEQESELARRLRDSQDIDAARELVLSHLRLVVSVARQYLGYGLPHADLIQEGNVGLMKAVKRFDPERGVRLVSFAVHWIKAEIHEYIVRNWRMVKVATTKAQRKLFFNLRSMRPDGQTLDSKQVDDIAAQLNVRTEDVREMEVRLSGREMSLENQDDDEDAYAPIAYLSDEGHDDPTQVLERRAEDMMRGAGLDRALDALDPRSRRIVQARWLQDDSGATLHDLAEEFGVSAERIRQIEVAAMKKMRLALAH